MKFYLFLLIGLFQCGVGYSQKTIEMRNLWARPQVHISFNEYIVSFTLKDINKALALLRATNDSLQVSTCDLDTGQNYYYELHPGTRTEYHHPMQNVMQNQVGPYLLSIGHAIITNPKHKIVNKIIADIGQAGIGEACMFGTFYDPKTKTMVFSGRLNPAIYNADLGIDD